MCISALLYHPSDATNEVDLSIYTLLIIHSDHCLDQGLFWAEILIILTYFCYPVSSRILKYLLEDALSLTEFSRHFDHHSKMFK